MTSLFTATLTDVTIPNGTSVSRWVESDGEYSDAVNIRIGAPAGLDAHTFGFETSDDPAGTNVRTIYTGNPPVALSGPAASIDRDYWDLPRFRRWRIKDTSGNVGADRTFKVSKTWR